MTMFYWLTTLLLACMSVTCQQDTAEPRGERHPPSPCPMVFSYENDRTWNTRWYGVILVDTLSFQTFNLQIVLTHAADLLGTWAGSVSSEDNKNFLLEHPAPDINGRGNSRVSVRFFVNFPREGPVPRVAAIWKDGHKICGSQNDNRPTQNTQSPSIQRPTRPPNRPPSAVSPTRPPQRPTGDPNYYATRPPTTSTRVTTPSTLTRPATRPTLKTTTVSRNTWPMVSSTTMRVSITFPSESSSTTAGECGKIDIRSVPFLVNGASTYHGEWPWHAAIYSASDGNPKYSCGGTLISKRAILTAGHCVTNVNNGRTVPPDQLIIYLGKHSLPYGWTTPEGIQTYTPESIIRHPTYDRGNLTGDISIILLGQDVNMTQYVRKICLWPRREQNIRQLENQLGTVVGWGYDSNNVPTTELQKTRLKVRSYEDCIRSHRDFFSRFLVDKTYCAGFNNGTSACNGDSGGGMVFERDGRWHIRGIVSNGVPRKDNPFLCSPEHYTIFVDVAQYRDWILQQAPELNNNV